MFQCFRNSGAILCGVAWGAMTTLNEELVSGHTIPVAAQFRFLNNKEINQI